MRSSAAVLTAALLGLPLVWACGEAEPTEPRHVILLTIDALRADAVSYAGYGHPTTPELDRIAADAAVFTTAISSHLGTPPAMASLVTGRYPSFEGIPQWNRATHHGFSDLNAPDENDGLTNNVTTLAELFSAAGFRTAGFNTNPNLSSRWRFDQGFEEYEQFSDYMSRARNERSHRLVSTYAPADIVVDRVLGWLDDLDERRIFLWAHLMEPHSPYLPPPAFSRLFPHEYSDASDLEINEVLYRLLIEQYPGVPPEDFASLESLGLTKERFIAHARGLYDGEIRFADTELGRLRRGLEERSLWDETLLVVTSDHGEEFLDHGHVIHHLLEAGLEELIRVPLLIRAPRSRGAGRVIEDLVRMVDVAPTILDLAGLGDLTARMDGLSLAPAMAGRTLAPRTAFMSGVDFGIARDARWKYRLERARPGAPEPARELLFDIVSDPLERQDLAGEHPQLLEQMRSRYLRFAARLGARSSDDGPPPGAPPELDPELRRRLEALGYFDG